MFAKLVSNNTIGSAFSANVFYNTLIGVITGAITSNNQLDAVQFNRDSSYITTVVPPGWSVQFPCANIGFTGPLPGANAIMIKANWTDSNDYAKYLTFQHFYGGAAAAGVTQNTSVHIRATASEGYNYTGSTLTLANTQHQINAVIATTNTSSYSAQLGTLFYPFIGPFVTGNGFVTIVSCSQAHLFIASYKDINATQFNGYYYLTEYSRDDPWNTVSNGYPSWLVDMAANNQGVYAAAATNTHVGYLARVLETKNNVDVPWAGFWNGAAGLANSAGNWGITARDTPHGQGRLTPAGTFQFPFLPRGLATTSLAQFYSGNYAIGRDANKNPSASMNELRVVGLHMDANITSNSVFAGGSINAVAPYVYAFRSQYNALDQVVFNGNTYTHVILNVGASVGQTNTACYLIREV